MTNKDIIRTSKFLSRILRHEPERVGLKLGEAGVEALPQAVNLRPSDVNNAIAEITRGGVVIVQSLGLLKRV